MTDVIVFRKGIAILHCGGQSQARDFDFKRHNVQIVFDKLKNLYHVGRCFAEGSRVFNLDEMFIATVVKFKNVLASKAQNKFQRFHPVKEGS